MPAPGKSTLSTLVSSSVWPLTWMVLSPGRAFVRLLTLLGPPAAGQLLPHRPGQLFAECRGELLDAAEIAFDQEAAIVRVFGKAAPRIPSRALAPAAHLGADQRAFGGHERGERGRVPGGHGLGQGSQAVDDERGVALPQLGRRTVADAPVAAIIGIAVDAVE